MPLGMVNGMEAIPIDGAGRVVLPKKVRERFNLRAGDRLSLKVHGGAIELRPSSEERRLERVNGILVFGTGNTLDGVDLVENAREERISRLIHDSQG